MLKTKYNSKEKANYVINEMTLNPYKFTNYKIINKLSENLFTSDWTLGEEIKLLGAIERLGLNNWEEISKILGKGKLECESHYYTFYYKSKNDFLPNDKLINKNINNNNSPNILIQNKNEETIKNFFAAQSAIKLNCYVCNKSIINQIKIILDPNYSKEKNFQKG